MPIVNKNYDTIDKKLILVVCIRYIQKKDPEAMFALSKLFKNGRYTQKNLEKAAYWLSMANNNGYHLFSSVK